LDAYKVDIFYIKSKLKVHAKIGFKLMNLNENYNPMLTKVKINLVVLASESELFNFLVLIFLRVSQREFEQQGTRQPLA
jgi:hypothetical protein